MVRNRNNIFIIILGIIILLSILFIIPKKITLKKLVLNKNYDFTNMIIKSDKEIIFSDKTYINYTLNELKGIEVKKAKHNIQENNKIELRFFSQNNPQSLNFNIYNKYIEIISSTDGYYNKNIYEVLRVDELDNIIKELEDK